MRESNYIRLFFALWPSECVRDQISDCLKSFPSNSGRLVPRYNWHMTLHFVGNTTLDEKNCLHRQAKKLSARPFDLCIDQAGYFNKPKVLWFGCRQPLRTLFDLQKNLGNEISQCEYQPETRLYSPHVTVARKVPEQPGLKMAHRICWSVDRFVLVESVSQPDGVHYQVMEEYLLC